ncbi:hypothetical protein MTO96_009174 [Rhipicephalus appendiculatus]
MECPKRARKTKLPARFEHFNLDDDSSDALDEAGEEFANAATPQDEVGVSVNISKTSKPAVRKSARGRFPCKKCGRCFDSRLKRTKHQFTHRGSARDAAPLECSKCQRKFSSRLTLVEHEAWHESRMLYTCHICGRQFRQNSGLWRHQRTHNPDLPKRRYPCPPRSDLRRHRKTHDGERRFECAICKRRFSNQASQKRHEKEHDPARSAPCPECGATFKRPCQLKEHVAKYHGDVVLLKLLVPKKRSSQTTSALRVERKQVSKPLSQHCNDSVVLQRIDRHTTDAVPSQPKGDKDRLLRERLTAHVDVAPTNNLQICSSSEMNGNPGRLQQQHSSSGRRATEFGPSGVLLSSTTAQSTEPTEQMPTGRGSNAASLATLQATVSADTEAAEQGDILQRSLKVLRIECIEGDFGAEPETNFVSHPDFGSQAYYDWLSCFTSTCNLATLPLDTEMFTKVTQVLKTVSDALATPSGVLACRENFRVLLGILEDLHRAVGSHLNYVLETLQPSLPS